KRTPHVMPRIVVGIKSKPEMKPQRMDCGLRKTLPNERSNVAKAPAPLVVEFGVSFGSRINSTPLITRPRQPVQIQNRSHESPPLMIGQTRNEPADPPAIPNICVTPMNDAATETGKFFVIR